MRQVNVFPAAHLVLAKVLIPCGAHQGFYRHCCCSHQLEVGVPPFTGPAARKAQRWTTLSKKLFTAALLAPHVALASWIHQAASHWVRHPKRASHPPTPCPCCFGSWLSWWEGSGSTYLFLFAARGPAVGIWCRHLMPCELCWACKLTKPCQHGRKERGERHCRLPGGHRIEHC